MPLYNYFYVQVYPQCWHPKKPFHTRSWFAGNRIRTRDIPITSPPLITKYIRNGNLLSPAFAKAWDIKSHSSVRPSVCLSVCPSVTKTLTLAITFALLQIELWYLACVFLVTRPFRWYHVVTLTVTFDLLQGQICCRAGDHNSLNLLVLVHYKIHAFIPFMKVKNISERMSQKYLHVIEYM